MVIQGARSFRGPCRAGALHALAFGLLSCAGGHEVEADNAALTKHVVAFDRHGAPTNATRQLNGWQVARQKMGPAEYTAHVRSIMDQVHTWLADDARNRRVVVFVHGGLNTRSDLLARVRRCKDEMLEDGSYPIFVAWDSGLVSCYFSNLLYRQGSVRFERLLALPYLVATDVVRGVLKIAPRTYEGLLDVYQRVWNQGVTDDMKAAASIAAALRARYETSLRPPGRGPARPCGGELTLPIQVGGFRREDLPDDYRYSMLSPRILLLPVRWVTSFVVDAFGNGAWQGMERRAALMFHGEEEFTTADPDPRPEHGLGLLMSELRQLQTTPWVEGLEAIRDLVDRLAQKVNDAGSEARYGRMIPSAFDGDQELGEHVLRLAREGGLDELLARLAESEEKLLPLWEVILQVIAGNTANWEFDALQDLFAAEDAKYVELARDALQGFRARAGAEVTSADYLWLLQFVRGMVEGQIQRRRANQLEVTVIGHSMGTIILNELFHGAADARMPLIKNVVYMAAACSVRDIEEYVYPYLKRHQDYGTRFYQLVLHPMAESEEINGFDLGPRGTLLVYIDEYLSDPLTYRDRTAGQFVNLMLSAHNVPPELQNLISIKMFPVGDPFDADVERHGAFTRIGFWKEETWRTDLETRRATQQNAAAVVPPSLPPARRPAPPRPARRIGVTVLSRAGWHVRVRVPGRPVAERDGWTAALAPLDPPSAGVTVPAVVARALSDTEVEITAAEDAVLPPGEYALCIGSGAERVAETRVVSVRLPAITRVVGWGAGGMVVDPGAAIVILGSDLERTRAVRVTRAGGDTGEVPLMSRHPCVVVIDSPFDRRERLERIDLLQDEALPAATWSGPAAATCRTSPSPRSTRDRPARR